MTFLEPGVYKATAEDAVVLADDITKRIYVRIKLKVPWKGTVASIWQTEGPIDYPESHHLNRR